MGPLAEKSASGSTFVPRPLLATLAARHAHPPLHRPRPADCGPPMRSYGRIRRLIDRRRRRVLPAAAWRHIAGATALPMMNGWCRRSDKAADFKSERKCGTPSSPPKEGCSHADLVAFKHTSCTLVATTIATSLTTRVRRRAWRCETDSRRSDAYHTQIHRRPMSGGVAGARWCPEGSIDTITSVWPLVAWRWPCLRAVRSCVGADLVVVRLATAGRVHIERVHGE